MERQSISRSIPWTTLVHLRSSDEENTLGTVLTFALTSFVTEVEYSRQLTTYRQPEMISFYCNDHGK